MEWRDVGRVSADLRVFFLSPYQKKKDGSVVAVPEMKSEKTAAAQFLDIRGAKTQKQRQ